MYLFESMSGINPIQVSNNRYFFFSINLLRVLTIIIFILLPIDGNAQWVAQNSGITTHLNGVYFINTQYGWACGDNGIIIRTSDGGDTWVQKTTGVNVRLNDLYFLDENYGWVTGNNGTVLYTYDGGGVWWPAVTPGPANIYYIQFISPYEGYASAEYGVLKSTDAGETWNNIYYAQEGYFIMLWSSPSTAVMFCSGNDFTAHKFTKDGAVTWSGFVSDPAPAIMDVCGYKNDSIAHYWGVNFLGSVLHIRDDNFIEYSSIPIAQFLTVTVEPGYNPLKLWAAGAQGLTVTFQDSGRTWVNVETGTGENIHEIYFPEQGVGWAVGQAGTILKYDIISGIGEAVKTLPEDLSISDPYPNPFNSSTKINFSVGENKKYSIVVYNSLGEKIKEIANTINQGENSVTWDGRNATGNSCPSGTYLVLLESENYQVSKKISLLK